MPVADGRVRLSVPKKLSIGAFSQQFPFRLIDWVIAAARGIINQVRAILFEL
jgi:hypothetical protein